MVLAQLKSGRVLIGLGNPSTEYENTRHNIGQIIVSSFEHGYLRPMALKYPIGARVQQAYFLDFPKIFMNTSGEGVKEFIKMNNIPNSKIIVVHDDLSFVFQYVMGPVSGKGSAGHKGVQSIIESLGTDEFNRVRVGVGPRPKSYVDEFVLSKFSKVEEKQLKGVIEDAKGKIVDWDEKQKIVETQN